MRKLNQQKYCSWCGNEVKYISEGSFKCVGCKYTHYINHIPCTNIMISKDDKLMMVRRAISPMKGKVDFPGGFMDITDKSIEEAALRELNEEINIKINDITEFHYFSSGVSSYEWLDTELKNVCFYFICKLKNTDKSILLDHSENSEIIWVSEVDLPNIDFAWDIDKHMLSKYFKRKVE